MPDDRNILVHLAENRRRRLQPSGRPLFDLTAEEVESSTKIAMRLAQASTSQIEREPVGPAVAA